MSIHTAVAASFFALAFAIPGLALAAEDPQEITFWVEARPWTCADSVASVARELSE